ncbi:transcriptional antiterminator, BglG family [Halobacillus karajensis]|uniref:RNA-binding antitermination protein GlcT n=1 Tax=Halobacillus karajensis TaxID=195088 RepID=A0A024P5V9_9BACI|nr:PRD domain-containing protein [Halobacillus karajensis]CDQ20383.1 RNA-binding antitermination protein GlcT [Halobacillus karajensis]CDQ24148.1 RNA-binding antitermination protein GlcT [Halobacillus karajensis]CDQ27626.1 RNA-binding antitermination protein GlcT [Halobacillus karajensis]SEH92478.1 transcriptional antiterminator, BglG family [Halobacillus karajensis]
MEQQIKINKVLNNNVVIAAHPTYEEVVLIGKGIGFNRKKGDVISSDKADKTFLLSNEQEKEQYVSLLPYIDENLIDFMSDILLYIENRMGQELNQHIHVALTDHLAFAINRAKKNLQFSNPFLLEIESLYPKEYQIAMEVVTMIYDQLGIQFPEGEVGFIALHIHSAVTDKTLREINRHNQLITHLVQLVEDTMGIQIDKNSVDYHRLVQHLHRAIDRVYQDEGVGDEIRLANMLKQEYPVCYNLAWKLIKVMQKRLNRPVDESEAIYLTIHLQRLTHKT